MASFQELLSKNSAEVKPPKPLPPGSYLCIVSGQPEFAKIGAQQTDCINFPLQPVQALEDVDQDQLQVALDGAALNEKKINYRLFVTDAALWRLTKFLEQDL